MRRALSNLLILSGIFIIIFPVATEAYGYYKSLELIKVWERQASSQKTQAEKIRKDQDRLISSGELPDEEAIISDVIPTNITDSTQTIEKKLPFPKTKIIIPKIDVNQVVLEGTSPDVLKLGPGHYTGMANPGEKGNVGIAGHRVTYTHPFNRLDELSKGDVIILETIDYIYEYRVENMVVVDPKNVSTLQPTSDPKITLTTCNPKYSAKTRLNVQGVLVDTKPRHASVVRVVKEIFTDQEKYKPLKNKVKTYEELRKDLEKATKEAKKNPLSVDSYINLSKAYLALDLYVEAVGSLKKGELIAPNSTEIARLYALIDERKKYLQEEIAEGKNETAKYGALPLTSYLELGHIHMVLGEYQEAAEVFDKGTRLSPHDADLYFYKGTAYEKMRRYDLALDNFDQALLYDPTYKEVLEAIKRIKKEEPGNVPSPRNLHYRFRPQ